MLGIIDLGDTVLMFFFFYDRKAGEKFVSFPFTVLGRNEIVHLYLTLLT